MPLIDPTNDTAFPSLDPAKVVTGPQTNAPVVATVEPPSAVDLLDTVANLIEHAGLHHNEKFGNFVSDVRAFQRSLAAEKSPG